MFSWIDVAWLVGICVLCTACSTFDGYIHCGAALHCLLRPQLPPRSSRRTPPPPQHPPLCRLGRRRRLALARRNLELVDPLLLVEDLGRLEPARVAVQGVSPGGEERVDHGDFVLEDGSGEGRL